MGAELLDIDRHRRGKTLRPQHVEACECPSGLAIGGSPYFARALLLVTRGGLFWMVALGLQNARCAA